MIKANKQNISFDKKSLNQFTFDLIQHQLVTY